MSSLSPSAFTTPMSQGTPTGSSVSPRATVEGLPDRLYEIVTRLQAVDGLPDDLHTMTPEQTEIAADIIASFVSQAEILALLDENQESENEPHDWGSYDWKYWRDPRNPWSELSPGTQTAIQHGVNTAATFIGSIYVHTKLKKALLRRRLTKMRETKVRDRARGVGEDGPPVDPSKDSLLAGMKRDAAERLEVLTDFGTSAVRRIGGQPSNGGTSYGAPSREATSTEK